MPLDITRSDHSIEELRREACRCEDSKQARRLLGLAMALEGVSREVAARAAGMTRQTLRDWVIRYNARGIEGLKDKPKSGRPPRLKEAQLLADSVRHCRVIWRKGMQIAVALERRVAAIGIRERLKPIGFDATLRAACNLASP